MSFLDLLTHDQKETLISLPYRVGLKVSRSDSTGGGAADAEEMNALANILTGYAAEIFGAETVQYIICETVAHKERWPAWSHDLNTVERDCQDAIHILSRVVDEKEVSAFKRHLMEIGESVALAYREYDPNRLSFVDRLRIYLEFLKGKSRAARAHFPYKNFNQFINISQDERRALRSIAGALKTTYM